MPSVVRVTGAVVLVLQHLLQGVDESIPWQKKLKSREVNSTVADNNVLCDQSSACPDGTTCCKLASGPFQMNLGKRVIFTSKGKTSYAVVLLMGLADGSSVVKILSIASKNVV